MRNTLDRQRKELLKSSDYRSFLKVFFSGSLGEGSKSLSYGEFAKRAGFSSRAFMNDVVLGRKRLTPASIEKVKVGLKLNATWAKYFECLVALEEPSVRSPGKDQFFYRERLKRAKATIELRANASNEISDLSAKAKVLLQSEFPEVYAALGSGENGATLENIISRAKVSEEAAIKILKQMAEVGFVECRKRRYYPIGDLSDLDDLGSDLMLRADYFRSIEKARKRFDRQSSTDRSLFMTQTFLVSTNRLPELRQQVAELIKDYVIASEASEGDLVAELTVGFTHSD